MPNKLSTAMIAPMLHWEIENGTIQSGLAYTEAQLKLLMEDKLSAIRGAWSVREYKDALLLLHHKGLMEMWAIVECGTQHGCKTLNHIKIEDHTTIPKLDGHHLSCVFCGEGLVHYDPQNIDIYFSINGPAKFGEEEEKPLLMDGGKGLVQRFKSFFRRS